MHPCTIFQDPLGQRRAFSMVGPSQSPHCSRCPISVFDLHFFLSLGKILLDRIEQIPNRNPLKKRKPKEFYKIDTVKVTIRIRNTDTPKEDR